MVTPGQSPEEFFRLKKYNIKNYKKLIKKEFRQPLEILKNAIVYVFLIV